MASADTASERVRVEHEERFLRSESLRLLVRLLYVVAAAWAVVLGAALNDGTPVSWLVPIGLAIIALITHLLAKKLEVVASVWLPLGLVLLTGAYLWFRPGSLAVFLVNAAILIAAVVTPRALWAAIPLLACLLPPFISWQRQGAVTYPYVMASFVSAMTALSAWLSTRNLYLALVWSTYHRQEAEKSVEDLRQRRADLARLAHMLRDNQERLHYMNIQLEQAKLAAEEAYRAKQYFVANVSHELRTPLNLIIGFSEMMVAAPETYRVPLPPPYRGDLLAIYRNARHLRALIDDVLDLAQIEAKRLAMLKETVDLRQLVHETAAMIRELVRAKGVQLEIVEPPQAVWAQIDQTRIRQVLLNLLSNAARHTEKGYIKVEIAQQGQEAILTVRDTGSGIAPEQLAKAFQPFSQMSDRPDGGSGLGLALSKRFIELHGGRIWIESTVGKGTTVTFALPIQQEVSQVEASPLLPGRPKPVRHTKGQVLVLSDDTRVLSLLQRHIEGYDFCLAGNAKQAADLLRAGCPAATVMDETWRDGEVEALLADGLRAVPTIICPLPSGRRAGYPLGTVDYLSKPVTREDLAQALTRLPRPPSSLLIVDDNVEVVRLLTRIVQAHDPTVRVWQAFGGREGLEILRAQRPDAVLLDLLMPEMSGYEFLEEMRKDPALAEIPTVIVSVRAVEQELAPIGKEVRLVRQEGFSLTEVLQAVGALLQAIVPGETMAPASDAAPVKVPSG